MKSAKRGDAASRLARDDEKIRSIAHEGRCCTKKKTEGMQHLGLPAMAKRFESSSVKDDAARLARDGEKAKRVFHVKHPLTHINTGCEDV